MVERVIQHKNSITDGATILGGGVVATISDHVPFLIGIFTVILLVFRIYMTYLEIKQKRRELDD